MSTRAQRIENIINGRKPFATELSEIIEHLEGLDRSLSELEKYRQQLQHSVDETETRQKLAQLDFESSKQKLLAHRNQLEVLAERFSRDTLNIGVIGETGAGKSTLLKSLSGLDDDVIPARRGGACTAVRSKIQNLPSQEKDKVTANIELHTPTTFLAEVIKQYYDKLPLESAPSSLDEFAQENFSLESPPEIKGKKEEQMYKHLVKDYYQNLSKYRPLLESQEPIKKVVQEKKDISEWVTQQRNQEDCLTTFKHLVVRQAEISCPFKDATTNQYINDKIMLVDVPGMGDTRLGDEDLMLETIGKDVDAVLYLVRPDAKRYLWKENHDQLYYNAKKALNSFEKRTFIILNNQVENKEACENLQKNQRFNVVEHKIIDCADPKQAYEVFNLILDHLERNINDLDRKYAQSVKDEILKTLDEIEECLKLPQDILKSFGDEQRQFRLLFIGLNERSGLWGEITNSLGKFRDELKEKCHTEDKEFKEKIENTIQTCRESLLPDSESIKREAYPVGGLPDIYLKYLQEIRTELSRKFLTLDLDLQDSLENVKVELANKLAEKGKLKFLCQTRGAQFFQEIKQELSGNRQDNLYFGFNYIEQFNVSFAGVILRETRKYLTELYSDKNLMADNRSSENIVNNLTEISGMVLENCEKSLQQLSKLPNQISYAMVEEFVDRIFYARGVKEEWGNFLWQKRYQVFDELKHIGEWKKKKQRWNELLIDVQEKNQTAMSVIKQVWG